MWTILGFLIVVCASILECYCSSAARHERTSSLTFQRRGYRFVLEGLWMLLLIGGAIILFLFSGFSIVAPVIAIVLFWLVFPFIINPIMRTAILPQWDDVKEELGPKGYTEQNYWRGNWWMKDAKVKRRNTKN